MSSTDKPASPSDNSSPAESAAEPGPSEASPEEGSEREGERGDRKLSDILRRAVAAGFEVAGRGKDDLMRAAAGEIKTWLDHLDLDAELAKALTRVVVEVKAEIRFRPKEDGSLEPTTETDVKVKKA